jgi:predicted RNA-binding protein with PIN domain
MLYLIDGHNLIPKIGLKLESMDDENELITLLRDYCRLSRDSAEVYFDGAPAGHAATRKAGAVTAHYVRKGSSADSAIENRLGRLAKQARNWTVVSSDHRVQAAARAAHAIVLPSDDFAEQVSRVKKSNASIPKKETTLAPEEVEEWLKIFENKRGRES